MLSNEKLTPPLLFLINLKLKERGRVHCLITYFGVIRHGLIVISFINGKSIYVAIITGEYLSSIRLLSFVGQFVHPEGGVKMG